MVQDLDFLCGNMRGPASLLIEKASKRNFSESSLVCLVVTTNVPIIRKMTIFEVSCDTFQE